MVSLDDAVTARLERGGSRYEILVDPELVQAWKDDSESVDLSDRDVDRKAGRHRRRFSDKDFSVSHLSIKLF